jgi:hypothetical protein
MLSTSIILVVLCERLLLQKGGHHRDRSFNLASLQMT